MKFADPPKALPIVTDDDTGEYPPTHQERETMTTPADSPLDDLPVIDPGDVVPGPDGGGLFDDPLTRLGELQRENVESLGRLTQEGVNLTDGHTLFTAMIANALLEAILTTVAGEGAVHRVLIDTHLAVKDMISAAETQVRRAKLAGNGAMPRSNRAQRRG